MSRLGQFISIFLLLLDAATADKKCNSTNLVKPECGPNEMCVATLTNREVGTCECISGFELNAQSTCVAMKRKDRSEPSSSSLIEQDTKEGNVAAAIIVPVLLIALVMAGVYVGYRYKVVAWVRNKMNRRSANYDEVMIGQDLDDDDPPLR